MYKLNLQLFATKKEGSTSGSSTSSSSSTSGGSTSHTSTTGGSHSETNSENHSAGGSHAESGGKNWLSGEVEENTQAHRDVLNTDYNEGQKVQDAYQRLQETLSGKPQFQSKYEDKLSQMYDQIMNRDKFSYNFNADPMYQLYKEQYTQQGKQAMQDTQAMASAMTGGYGSSYAQSVGQQQYQNYLQRLNDTIPVLRDQAYQQYQAEGQEMLNKYNITNDAYNREYGQYRDDVSDWNADRNFNYGMYTDERNFDYNQFTNERDYWNREYWQEKQAEQSNSQVADENNWNDTYGHSETDTQYWEDSTTSSSFWENSSSNSSTNSWTNPTTGATSNIYTTSGKDRTNSSNWKSVDDVTGSNKQQSTGNNLAVAPYDIPNSSYLKEASNQEINQMVSDIASAQSAFERAQIEMRMKAQTKMSDNEIKLLEELALGNRSWNGTDLGNNKWNYR